MLTKLYCKFTDKKTAQIALTEIRKKYRIALRGACITGPDYHGSYSVHVPLGNTGFSNAELSAEMRVGNY